MRCNTLRIEEVKGIMQYTDNQEDIEKYTNQRIKGRSLFGDLRVRKNEDGLPKELIPRKVPTLNRRDKVIRTIVNYKNLEKEWKEKVSEEAREVRLWEKEAKKVMDESNEKGFKKGNKPKILRKIYDGKQRKDEMNK
jgi:hypothetical protein